MAMDEVGSLRWGEATGGVLTRSQRWTMRWRSRGELASLVRSRVLLILRRHGHTMLDLESLRPPDTRLAAAVEDVARREQTPVVLAHAYRTVAFAHAIASLDRVAFDPELLWCAALLHDVGLEHPVTGRCFAVRGGEIARQTALAAGATAATADLLGDAVCRHPSPRLDPQRHPLPYLVAAGALVDVVGRRLEQLDHRSVEEVLADQPRGDFARTVATAWRTEAHSVRHGRAAVADQLGLSLAARWAPFPAHREP
ncbi:MAG: HD domain-containing protein [Propionibacteriaceae bacterium]